MSTAVRYRNSNEPQTLEDALAVHHVTRDRCLALLAVRSN